jgi:hypothetical protein
MLRIARRPHWWMAGLILAIALLALGGQSAQAQDAQWLGLFWNNRDLSGEPALTRWENSIDFNWMGGSPDPVINSDNFSARWTRRVAFDAGNYRFFATMDDGMRVWLNNELIIDGWRESQEHTMTVDRFVPAGVHDLRVEFFEAGGMAVARFRWELITADNAGPTFPNWRAEYFNVPNLVGAPVLVRDDRYLNQSWEGSPGPGVNEDFWSARWTRTIQGAPGFYNIILTSDDGSRLWINNQLVIDNWRDQATTASALNYWNSGNALNVRVEFYDSYGPAFIRVDLVPLGTGGGAVPPTPGNCPTPTGMNAVVIATAPLNVRTGPSTMNEAITQLQPCQVVPLTGFRSADNAWVQIILPTGQTGWVSAQWVALGVPMSSLRTP